MVKVPPESFLIPFRGVALRGQFYTRMINGRPYVSRWPRSQKGSRTTAEADNRKLIAQAASLTKYMSVQEQTFSRQLAKLTKLAPRDLLMIALFRRLGVVVQRDGKKIYSMASVQDISAVLDALGQTPGDILLRGATWWTSLAKGTSGQVLGVNDDGELEWVTIGGGGGGGGIGCQISKQSGNQAIAAFTHVALDWDTSDYADTGFTVDLSADTITVLNPGYYLVNIYTQFTVSTQIADFVSVEKNGTVVAQSPQANRPAALSSQLSCIISCAANDVLKAFIDVSAAKVMQNTVAAPSKMLFQVNKV